MNKRITTIILAISLLSGCVANTTHIKSSVIDYLYSNDSQERISPTPTKLTLPLKVGIAFIPNNISNNDTILTANKKNQLLENVAENFRHYKFVHKLEVIPSAYLRPKGGFDNLAQIREMYDIDVIALVSYDQVQFTDENALSLSYLTIIGAYIFSGEKNDTSTLLDTTVYDIRSQKLLFRAPGSSNVKGTSTPINLSEAQRLDSIKGFQLATKDMIINLEKQLENFRQHLKKSHKKISVINKDSL